ncbi:MAG TPA: ankyrin repeat domain-containing protein [Magnetospirillaceae bacterium]|nr:ankyrin repeat domain-containing protein [Magnetospirillaceae bacterium]
MEIAILLDPSDAPHAVALLKILSRAGIPAFALKLGSGWEDETRKPLEFRIRGASHVLLSVSRDSPSSTWFAFAAGLCLGNDKRLALLSMSPQSLIPGYLSGIRVLDSLGGAVSYYQTEQAGWQVRESRSSARAALLELGIPYRSESMAECCREGNVRAVELFLKAGMIPDLRDRAGVTLLGLAIRDRHPGVAELLVEHGASLDLQSEDRGYSAVMDAASTGSLEITEYLLKRGADPNLASKNGQSALVIAVGRNDVPLCRVLLDHGADPDHPDKLGFSARRYAELFHNPEMVRLFAQGRR